VKNWQETSRIVARIRELNAADRRMALATVVSIAGSAYRRPGAKYLIEDSGDTLGGVSGGCLEADVRQVGLELSPGAQPVLRRYDTGDGDTLPWALGLGCNGTVEIFIQPVTNATARLFDAIRTLLGRDRPFAVTTVIAGNGAGNAIALSETERIAGDCQPALGQTLARFARRHLVNGSSGIDEMDGMRVFTETPRPPPWLLICGAGDDAQPLCSIASIAGFRVAVADHRPAFVTATRFPHANRLLETRPENASIPDGTETYAVIMTHSLKHDRAWIQRLVGTALPYLGVLGPRQRTEDLMNTVPDAGDRVYGPIGLDLGGDGPEQVALSIVSEILSVRAGRTPGHLRDKETAIHAV
jgi:xanthine dehydrogenase accessory factor